MNLVANPGFEIAGLTEFDADGWERVAPEKAFRVGAEFAHSGSAAGLLLASLFTLPSVGSFLQHVATTPGLSYMVGAWAKRATGNTGFKISDSVIATIASIDASAATGEWQYLSGLYVAPSADLMLALLNDQFSGVSSSWLVDDVSVEPQPIIGGSMPRRLLDAYVAVVNRLKTINGPLGGYVYDFSLPGRVITSLRFPFDQGSPEGNYLCVPLDDTGPITTDDGPVVRMTLRQPIYFMTSNDERDGVDVDSTPIRLLNGASDICRCIFPADGRWWNFGSGKNYVFDVTLAGKRLISESNAYEGFPSAHAGIVVDVSIIAARGEI